MILAVAGLMVAVQVTEARVIIDVGTGASTVSAEYLFGAAPEDVVFEAIRWPGQTISLRDSAGIAVEDVGGLIRLTPTTRRLKAFRVDYEVQGNLSRIPLFIPNVVTVPGVSDVTVVVQNAPVTTSITDAFPRFIRSDDGQLRAQPANLPSFVLVPSPSRVSRARVADGLVVLVLLCASGVWLFTKLRST